MKIFILLNDGYLGDNHQVEGIAKALSNKQSQAVCQPIKESDFDVSVCVKGDVILLSGGHGLQLIDKFKSKRTDIMMVFSSHKYYQSLEQLAHWPDFIAMPISALTPEQKDFLEGNTTLILTQGVAHRVTSNLLISEAKKFKGIIQPIQGEHLLAGIVLGGDVPIHEQQVSRFTAENARLKAREIVRCLLNNKAFSVQSRLLVTNGPRTGKHDEKGAILNPDPHRSGNVDNVSTAFMETLHSLLPNNEIVFYDFQFSELKHRPSAYLPMMNALVEHQCSGKPGMWFVPAESTSMVTESTVLTENGVQVIAYFPSSTQVLHKKHVEDFIQMGLLTNMRSSSRVTTPPKTESASMVIAKLVSTKLSKRQYKESQPSEFNNIFWTWLCRYPVPTSAVLTFAVFGAYFLFDNKVISFKKLNLLAPTVKFLNNSAATFFKYLNLDLPSRQDETQTIIISP